MGKNKKFFPTFLSGDTLIEVMFAVGIFGIASISAISAMNRGLQDAQGNLEITMARQEIDVQAESLRFIRDAYITEKSTESNYYTKIWEELLERTYTHNDLILENPNFYTNYDGNNYSCNEIYENLPKNIFVINPRVLGRTDLKNIINGTSTMTLSDLVVSNSFASAEKKIHQSATHPRLLFGDNESQADSGNLSDATETGVNYNKNLYAAEGIWVTSVQSSDGIDCPGEGNECFPDFYDFYIRTCWDRPGSNTSTTISSTIRLFNPDQATFNSNSEQQPICTRRNIDNS